MIVKNSEKFLIKLFFLFVSFLFVFGHVFLCISYFFWCRFINSICIIWIESPRFSCGFHTQFSPACYCSSGYALNMYVYISIRGWDCFELYHSLEIEQRLSRFNGFQFCASYSFEFWVLWPIKVNFQATKQSTHFQLICLYGPEFLQ